VTPRTSDPCGQRLSCRAFTRLIARCLFTAAVTLTAAMPFAAPAACQPPAKDIAWKSAVRDGELLSLGADQARLEVRAGSPRSTQGHWVHLSDGGPVNGVLAWWPCGAHRARWLSTGGFAGWRRGPEAAGAQPNSIWIETLRFATGLEVLQAHWATSSPSGARLIWEGNVRERLSGPVELTVERELQRLPDGGWQLVEQRKEGGRNLRVLPQRMCWATIRDTRGTPSQRHLVPCDPSRNARR
jgi:hypothetical protein